MWMNALLTAVVGYILVVLRDLPKNLVKYIHVGFSYSVLSTNKELYENINEWIFGLNKELINDNLNGCCKYSFGNKENFMAIDYGNYFFKIDKFTFVIVSKSIMQNNYDSHDKLTVKIIGKKKDIYKNEFLKCINVNKHENSIRIFPIPEMYINYSVPKKIIWVCILPS